jgi:hypothetical protein
VARIRTIKPEFFTSEDIVGLTPFARILYVALWCESDKEGRMVWKPKTFKMRYLPGDEIDVLALCKELTDAGLVVLYGDGFAYIPQFRKHQHINPRESDSHLPDPDASATRDARVSTRQIPDSDAQGGREGKEGKEQRDASRDDLPAGFACFWQTWPKSDRKGSRGECLKAWNKAKAEPVADKVVAHVESMKLSPTWLKNNGEFVPAPLVYINQRRWEGAEDSQASEPDRGFV